MFDGIGPKLKNLLPQSNIWIGVNTFKKNAIATTTFESIKLRNETAATATITVQEAPTLNYKGSVWVSDSLLTKGIESRSVLTGVSGASYLGNGILRTQLFKEGDGWRTATDLYNRDPSGNNGSKLIVYGAQDLEFSHGNQDPATSTALMFNNTSGQYINTSYKFAGTIKSALTVGNVGEFTFKTVNTGSYYFNFGSTVTSTSLQVQIYSGGIYNQGGSFNGGRVTAGGADTTPPAYLNTNGSFAARYVVSEATTVTFNENSTLYYLNPISTICSGTAQVCSTWTASGEATCNTHSGVGCSWLAEVTGLCSVSNYTDSGTCTGTNAACAWQTSPCSTFNNDSSGCTSAGWPSPPYCSFTAAVCSDFAGTEAGCNAASGCAADTLPCSAFDGTDQATCEANVGCSYAGDPVCSGTYYAGTCSGTYAGGDGVCSGSDYDTGICTGTWVITPAACIGTANCGNLPADATCTAETPCTISTGLTGTLPLSSAANEGGTSRIYTFVHIGASGTATINPGTGSTIMDYTSIKLYRKGDKVSVQNVITTANCTDFGSQTPCEAQSPCVWTAAVVCSDYNGNETECNNHSGNGCSYSDPNCTGAGTAASCGGTYISNDMWVPHNYERSKNYVEKTAAYTVTNEDDTVNYTSGTVAVTLPLSADITPRRPIYLKNRGAGTITINTTSSQLVDGNASGVLTIVAGGNTTVFPMAAGWIIL